jgi:hypothetical protein
MRVHSVEHMLSIMFSYAKARARAGPKRARHARRVKSALTRSVPP